MIFKDEAMGSHKPISMAAGFERFKEKNVIDESLIDERSAICCSIGLKFGRWLLIREVCTLCSP